MKATLNLITFADSATDKGTFTFSKATDTGYTDLLKVVNALSAVGGTNYVSALTKATANITAEMTAGTVANKQVFFISDGNPTTSPTAAQLTTWQNLMANPPGGNSSIPVTTIGLGSGISDVYLSKITTSKTIMTPSATQLDDILQANLFVGSVSGNVLLNDAKLTLDGKETISQVAYDGTVYKVVNGVLQVDKPNADVTSSYDAATGRLVLDSGMGVLTLYMKANSSNKAGDYIYQLRSGQLTTGTAITDNYVYTGVDSAGHTQTATLHINALVDNNITGAIVVQAMGKDSGAANDFITSDGDAGRLITGTVAKTLAAGNYLEVSTDGGKTWTKVTAYDGKQWAFVDKSAHTADWTIQVRVADNNGNSGFLTNQAVTQVAALHAPTITSIPKADDGLLTSTEANTAVDMVVSLGNTGAKAGDIVHVQWGVGLYDQALTAADIAAGSVTVSVPRTVTYTEQGVAYDFNVIASIVSNGVAGASSSAYRVVGGGFSTKAISDTFAANSAGSVANNVYTGTDFTVTTSGTGMAKTAAVSANHYAGLTLSDTSSANATVNLSQPATKFSVTLSGIDLAKSGATIYVYGVDGKELSQQVVTSTTYYKAFSYTAPTGVDVGSFKVVAGSDAVTLSGFSFTEALHVGDTRALSIDHLTDTFYGTGGDDTALLKYAASSYLASTSNQGIHGGDGVDTLKVENYNQTLDLTLSTSKGKITSMEIIDLTRGEGKVIPSSREQVIQSLEGGILEQMNVREGDVVEAGQVLLKIDPTRAGASFRETESKVLALKGQLARLRSEAYGKPLSFPPEVQAVPSIVQAETEAYNSRRRMLDEGIAGLQKSLSLAEGELTVSQRLAKQGLISDVEILRMQRAANDFRIQINERSNKYRSEANADLTRVESELAQSVENLAGREDVMKRTTITAPLKGIVKNVRVNTIGGVIQQGQDIMEIVPIEDRLLVEAKIRPADVAFLRPGLPATVKISAYDYAIYGGLTGKVELISPDTIKDDDMSRQGKPDTSFYRVLIRTDEAELTKGDKHFPIIPGMTATADIRTGEKTIMQYLL